MEQACRPLCFIPLFHGYETDHLHGGSIGMEQKTTVGRLRVRFFSKHTLSLSTHSKLVKPTTFETSNGRLSKLQFLKGGHGIYYKTTLFMVIYNKSHDRLLISCWCPIFEKPSCVFFFSCWSVQCLVAHVYFVSHVGVFDVWLLMFYFVSS